MYYWVKIIWVISHWFVAWRMLPGKRHQNLSYRRINLIGCQGCNSFKIRKNISDISWVDQAGRGNWCYPSLGNRFREKKKYLKEWDRKWIQRHCNVCRCTDHGGSFGSCTLYECQNWNPEIRKAKREIIPWVNIFTSWIEWHNS